MADSIKQELEAANMEIADLKRKMTATSEEKDALNSDYLASLSKVREPEEIIKSLKLESKRSENKISQLMVEIEDLRREVDPLKEENITVKQELESVRGEVSDLQPKLECAENQVTELSYNLNATVEDNKSLHSKLSEALNEVQQAQDKIQELMTGLSRSKDELVEKEEVLNLKELHEVHVNQSSAQIKELEAHVASLELELELLQAASRDMAAQIENKASEAEQLGEQNIGLQSRISELEMMSKKGEEELERQINNQQRMLEEQGESYKKLTGMPTG
ncbi:hypothetical protein F3Y22_tig00112072pilonHSYRG00013 [Hibiscus syriacus]|uniref:Uncharacterized protein n=1 Tax=Hibiscus syriacus TaxID=106335 RepID=A0A6A2X6R8_HIBSY|nr:COP1-interactive protein 1-like [Hibiscus syriacus]KAE8670822.1 hypothetical protein F3Y22_tig00112072pilonHSYRG00013 [Hibiscus syriacus]